MKHKFFIISISFLITQILAGQSIVINKGSGSFKINGGSNHEEDSITVFYHRPKKFTQSSKV